MAAELEYRHWTGRHSFRLVSAICSGVWGWDLYVDDRRIEFFLYSYTAAGSLARGDLDEKLGFSTKGLSIPDDVGNWNWR
jgi:hypothetical protein